MRRKLLLSLSLAMLLLVTLPGNTSYATPTAPVVLINESTRQCAIAIQGDECSWCDPPDGWTVIGPGTPGWDYTRPECPAGFQRIDRLEMSCKRYKSPYCCGGFASRGDCTDLVINATQKACAFVNDVNACVLPSGWSSRPTGVAEANWSCDFNQYQWVDNLGCLTVTPTAERLPLPNVAARSPAALPAAGIGLIVVGGGLLAWLVKRRP